MDGLTPDFGERLVENIEADDVASALEDGTGDFDSKIACSSSDLGNCQWT